MITRGRYIVIEGNDGTGKSTQVRLLQTYFHKQGYSVVTVEEPGGGSAPTTPAARYLRAVIKNGRLQRDPEINLALFSAARRELWQHSIAPALERGAVVLAARNYLSTLAYQGYGEGLDLDHIRETTALFTDARYMAPDHVVVLVMNDDIERKRRLAERSSLIYLDAFESRADDFQRRVDNGYAVLARDMSLPVVECAVSDHYKTPAEIRAEILQIIS